MRDMGVGDLDVEEGQTTRVRMRRAESKGSECKRDHLNKRMPRKQGAENRE